MTHTIYTLPETHQSTLDLVAVTRDYLNSLTPEERQEFIQRATSGARFAPTLPGDYTCEAFDVVDGV